MINLNDSKYDIIPYITKEQILSLVSEEEIFKFYYPNLIINKAISSPFREDKHPSFGVFYSNKHACLLYKDLSKGDVGDCIQFVMKLHFITDYQQALHKIVNDLNLNIKSVKTPDYNRIKIVSNILRDRYGKTKFNLKIKSRKWYKQDILFWQQFGITYNTLKFYNVVPVSYIFINDRPIKTEPYSYAYIEYKDNKVSYKVYQPYSELYKWTTNHSYSAHQGYRQLPPKGKLLIVTKSLKDVMSIRDCCMIPSIGIQAESVLIKESVMDEYKDRFNKVICLFDNDRQGKEWSEKFKQTYNLPYILIPDKYHSKDFSDLVKTVGKYNAKNVLNNLYSVSK